jgi:5-methylcytosine-specific restriction endonuclease McrA
MNATPLPNPLICMKAGFYSSPRWRALRLVALDRDRWCCTICGTSVRRKGAARVDHIHPRSTHPHLELDLRNLRTLCPSCDNQGHREKGQHNKHGSRNERFVIRGYDRNGLPNDPKHHWLMKG